MSRRARVLSVLVAAVTVVALALGGVAISLVRQAQQPQVAEPQVTQTPQPPQVDPALLAAPDARIRRTKLLDGTEVSFVVSKEQNRAAFVSADLPSPGAGNEYHLWTLKGDTVVRPDAMLPGRERPVQLFTVRSPTPAVLAINIQPAGSAPTVPTTQVLGSVTIDARPVLRPPGHDAPRSLEGRARVPLMVDYAGATPARAGARATLAKRRTDVAAMFDGVAARYDLANDVLSLGQDRAWRRAVVEAVDAAAGRAGARPGGRDRDLERAVRRRRRPGPDRPVARHAPGGQAAPARA